MGRVSAYRDIDRINLARLLLANALEDAFRAGSLDPHRYSRIRELESARELLRERDVERRIERELALLARRLDQDGLTAVGGGAAAFTEAGKTTPAASAADAPSTSRLK